jgi:hypothetical protein
MWIDILLLPSRIQAVLARAMEEATDASDAMRAALLATVGDIVAPA